MLVWESKEKHPASTVFCQLQDGIVSLGEERCRGVFLEGDPCSQQRAGREWAGWEGDVCVSAGSAQPPTHNSAGSHRTPDENSRSRTDSCQILVLMGEGASL